jgi:hypothetical protein
VDLGGPFCPASDGTLLVPQMSNPRLAHADLLRGIELLGTEVAPRVADA